MLSGPLSMFVNHLLAPAAWARQSLTEHAGKIAAVDLFPLRIAVAIDSDGTLRPAPANAPPAVTIRLTHATVLQFLAEAEEAWRRANVDGDTGFAAALPTVAANLRCDVKDDLTLAFGDFAAHRAPTT